jgi:hypothetical protein
VSPEEARTRLEAISAEVSSLPLDGLENDEVRERLLAEVRQIYRDLGVAVSDPPPRSPVD